MVRPPVERRSAESPPRGERWAGPVPALALAPGELGDPVVRDATKAMSASDTASTAHQRGRPAPDRVPHRPLGILLIGHRTTIRMSLQQVCAPPRRAGRRRAGETFR